MAPGKHAGASQAGSLAHLPGFVARQPGFREVLAALAQTNLRSMPRCLAIGLEAVPPSGRNDEVLAALGLDAKGIAERVSGFLNEIAAG